MLPIIFQSNSFTLYSYPLFMGLGWGIAYQIYFSLIDKSLAHVKAEFLFWGVFVSAWIGAKILFLLTFKNPEQIDFAGELSFWTGGGFVFYGGFLLAMLFLGINKLFDKEISLKTLWPMIPAMAIGHGVGRIGCFLAGCCFGKPTQMYWGVFMHNHYRHPTQLLEAIGLITIGICLMRSHRPKLLLMSYYLISYSLLRFWMEALRGDQVRGLWGVLTPSQWISLTLLFCGLGLIFKYKNKVLS